MLEGQIIALSVKDFFTKPMLKIAILPLLFTMIIMLILFYSAADYGFDSLQITIEQSQSGEEVQINENAPFYFVWTMYVIAFLFKYSITSWLVGFLVYTVGTIFVMMFSVLLTIVIIGFLTPMILKVLQKRHYTHIQTNGFATLLSPLWVLLKSVLVMLLLFILLIPLYFIPLLNIIAINIPFYYFFHKLLTFDVASTILTQDEYSIIHGRKANAFRFRTIFLYFISMIPFITLFSAVFYIIYLGHSYFLELEKLRGINLNTSDINDNMKNDISSEKKEEIKLIEND